MAIDPFSPPALLEAKRDHDVAPRMKTWPPEGYIAPTEEEFDELRRTMRQYVNRAYPAAYWKRTGDEQVVRHLQLIPLLDHRRTRSGESDAVTYARALRRELDRRGLTYTPIEILRCTGCSHGTERLFEATQDTHPGLVNKSGTKVKSAWFCARCWSNDNADEGGTGDGES